MTRVEQVCLSAWLKRLQAVLCLVPLLAGQAGVFPGLLAIAAARGGAHTVYAGISKNGFKLVLSHERGQPGRPDFLAHHQPTNPAHHHGLTARVLCALGGSTQRLADHEACFSGGGPAESSAREVRLASKRSAGKAIAALMSQISSFVSARCITDPCRHERVDVPDTVQELRTTLLLI
jgi:hypothetical protein